MSSAVEHTLAGTGTAAVPPFWFDLWQTDGWSRRVARNWSQDAAFRGIDQSFLGHVMPTLAPSQKMFVERVLRDEERRLG